LQKQKPKKRNSKVLNFLLFEKKAITYSKYSFKHPMELPFTKFYRVLLVLKRRPTDLVEMNP